MDSQLGIVRQGGATDWVGDDAVPPASPTVACDSGFEGLDIDEADAASLVPPVAANVIGIEDPNVGYTLKLSDAGNEGQRLLMVVADDARTMKEAGVVRLVAVVVRLQRQAMVRLVLAMARLQWLEMTRL